MTSIMMMDIILVLLKYYRQILLFYLWLFLASQGLKLELYWCWKHSIHSWGPQQGHGLIFIRIFHAQNPSLWFSLVLCFWLPLPFLRSVLNLLLFPDDRPLLYDPFDSYYYHHIFVSNYPNVRSYIQLLCHKVCWYTYFGLLI